MQYNVATTLQNKQDYARKDTSLNRDIVRWAMNAPYLERTEEYNLASRWEDTNDSSSQNSICSYAFSYRDCDKIQELQFTDGGSCAGRLCRITGIGGPF